MDHFTLELQTLSACKTTLRHYWFDEVRLLKSTDFERNITKTQFAEVFIKAFVRLAPKIVKNGFRACGLYPSDSAAIDTTKCLGKIMQLPEEGKKSETVHESEAQTQMAEN